MNRAERRRLEREKQKGNKTLVMSADNIKAIKEQATSEAADRALTLMLSIPLMVLRDKWGFGKKRLEKFTEQVIDLYGSFDQGYVTFEDLQNTLKEEVGVSIEVDRKKWTYSVEKEGD